jgi:hypothetical protein
MTNRFACIEISRTSQCCHLWVPFTFVFLSISCGPSSLPTFRYSANSNRNFSLEGSSCLNFILFIILFSIFCPFFPFYLRECFIDEERVSWELTELELHKEMTRNSNCLAVPTVQLANCHWSLKLKGHMVQDNWSLAVCMYWVCLESSLSIYANCFELHHN